MHVNLALCATSRKAKRYSFLRESATVCNFAPMTTAESRGSIPTWTVGERLCKAREWAGLDQGQLADLIGVSRSTVSNYERGTSKKPPKKIVLNAWALATGVARLWLEADESPHPAGPNGGNVSGNGNAERSATNDYSSKDTSRVLIPFPQVTGPGSAPARRVA